jgi:hypothetical protein
MLARCPSEISWLSKVSSKPDQAFRDRELNVSSPARFLFETVSSLEPTFLLKIGPDIRYFSTRSLASDCPIELNTDKVWFGSVTRKNLSVRFQCGDLVFLIGAAHHEYFVRKPV